MVYLQDGIGLGKNALIVAEIPGYGPDAVDPAQAPDTDQMVYGPWVPWGSANDMPYQMATLIEKCGVLNAALDAKARISVGKGIQPFLLGNIDSDGKEELEWVGDDEIHAWLEENDLFSTMMDMSFDENAYGWSAGSIIMNKAMTKINKLRRIDVYEARLQVKNKKTFQIENIYLSDDWSKTIGTDKGLPAIPVLKERDEYDDLVKRLEGGSKKGEYAFLNRRRRNGRQYYPYPMWWSAREWVRVASEIPAFKRAMFSNQMQIKYVVTISRMYWEENYPGFGSMPLAERTAIINTKYNDIDNHLTGTEAAYKSIFSSTYVDPVTKVETPHISIEVLDDKIRDGKLLPESSAANSEILFALAVNPALMGAGQPGGPYSNNAGGSNIRESLLTAMMAMEAERKMTTRMLPLIKKINKWDRLESDSKRLVWRFPSGLLTTLDTGKSTKAENL